MRVVVAGTLYLTRLPSLKPHRSYGMIKLYRPELARSRQWCKHCAPHASAPSPLAAGLRSLRGLPIVAIVEVCICLPRRAPLTTRLTASALRRDWGHLDHHGMVRIHHRRHFCLRCRFRLRRLFHLHCQRHHGD